MTIEGIRSLVADSTINLVRMIINIIAETISSFTTINRINANSDRPDPADRGYYEPAPGRHWYAGASYAW